MTTKAIEKILARALTGYELSPQEGVLLLQQTELDAIAAIRDTANQLRCQQVGDTVTYVINRNINFTNICEQHCSFCAFRRDADEAEAYWLEWGQILEKTTDAVQRGATEICMQGGLNPQAKINGRSLLYYLKLIETIKAQFPQLHLHAFSPQEVAFIARKDDISYASVIAALRDAGVDSMPGTAAEVLDDRVRRILCPEKINTATWIEIVSTAHRLGVPTTSTMLSGHIETPQQQIHHLQQLRSLQQTSQRRNYPATITEFILLPFVGQEAPKPLRRRVGRDQPLLADALLLTAVARLFLGHAIPNHQPSWVKLGLTGATEALKWGCNDIGGTLMEEHITTMAGAIGGTCMEVETLHTAISSLNRPHAQRDTLYYFLKKDEKHVRG
ncbi:7,8-didemethyl-8-hydroxy-5-deazariboflavin synthase subunit CofH [Gloeocapsopsis dulcis]|uniref:5-amino-6-(D-ribitylamino)uracil--L-tyrosine 4-hydroxyphenyl transferase n=1 Tax=Gloeocapsopsis dulcis AAB1 = 1H9 TaxID=1433147 RepID=A0A6N8G0I9_9CHRO|nr:7,8-didemethyl-8-hydroxy-5-deazariboflavin synthase subunit CofH [Gloeocapsopsis dulcis]MUL37666.1 7,8-didemethyl-8-hydroxy-5-deazariboflavin synthase subunit CofH [Gloeocapsopsis dulcis AAB1 = 1H9]WNN88504.1 7,8-didemethyl-8-hydroxy-5-deazariboflavin synthase subunit CofH [Gloeocapsopsis dulcis]